MAAPINVPPNTFFIPVNLSSSFKTFTLPVVSTNPGRVIIFKDAFGNAVNSSLRLSTLGLDRIERSTISSIALSNRFGAWTFMNDGITTWFLTDAYLNTMYYSPAIEAGASLYAFTSNTFTNAGATGQTGPILSQCVSAYSATQPWVTNTAFFNMTTQGIQLWTVPQTGNYQIICAGAQGGSGSSGSGGLGATMTGTFALTSGAIIKIMVGQQGVNGSLNGGGGGGSFVTTNTNTPLICAGGGGGAPYQSHSSATANIGGTTATSGNPGTIGQNNSTSGAGVGGTAGGGGGTPSSYGNAGAGGGGLTGNGSDATPISSLWAKGGKSFTNGGVGGDAAGSGSAGAGGFGGGGGADWYYWTGAGGAGGYSGGGGGAYYGAGGGGGSINTGSSQTNVGSNRSGMGYVTIIKV